MGVDIWGSSGKTPSWLFPQRLSKIAMRMEDVFRVPHFDDSPDIYELVALHS